MGVFAVHLEARSRASEGREAWEEQDTHQDSTTWSTTYRLLGREYKLPDSDV